ncbi:PREDICTED: pentatricopeptide repeat-containing protein At2g25580-like [Tarenaya hassleriana]|uniref:pentatricopeptide repeat-containing protein At2g25580-like n=1 Tax=Tarenaya hassleriana TaxID=28532 RepID=UPI00053C0A5D|nr:PREDICTED: pentatricopeptide repeat-containing protein At2g25580-like [Tarenaya hassleriana]
MHRRKDLLLRANSVVSLPKLCRFSSSSSGSIPFLSRVPGDSELGDATRLSDKQSRAGLLPAKESDIAEEKLKKAWGIHNHRFHEFRAGYTADPENEKLYGLLKGLKAQMVDTTNVRIFCRKLPKV